jgi:hypothetical protein
MMAAQSDKDQSVSPETEVEEIPETDEDADEPEGDGEIAEATSTIKEKGRRPSSIFHVKWIILLFSIGIIGAIVGLGMRFGPQYLPDWRKKPLVSPTEPVKDNMREEPMAPFFVPLPPGTSKGVIRIDLSLIVDGLAYFHYSKKDVQARDRLYKYLVDKAGKDQDLNAQISFLEMEMSAILRESLGVNSVLVRIREVKAF